LFLPRVGLYVSFLPLAYARGKTSWHKGLPVVKTIYTYGFHELFLKLKIMLIVNEIIFCILLHYYNSITWKPEPIWYMLKENETNWSFGVLQNLELIKKWKYDLFNENFTRVRLYLIDFKFPAKHAGCHFSLISDVTPSDTGLFEVQFVPNQFVSTFVNLSQLFSKWLYFFFSKIFKEMGVLKTLGVETESQYCNFTTFFSF
jgi:hypothetical protein